MGKEWDERKNKMGRGEWVEKRGDEGMLIVGRWGAEQKKKVGGESTPLVMGGVIVLLMEMKWVISR